MLSQAKLAMLDTALPLFTPQDRYLEAGGEQTHTLENGGAQHDFVDHLHFPSRVRGIVQTHFF